MAKVQKTYTKEFKEEAVRLAQTSGKSIAQVARELGISDTSIHQWRKELAAHGKEAFPESRAPNSTRRRESSSQTRAGESPTGA
jgi:transposase